MHTKNTITRGCSSSNRDSTYHRVNENDVSLDKLASSVCKHCHTEPTTNTQCLATDTCTYRPVACADQILDSRDEM